MYNYRAATFSLDKFFGVTVIDLDFQTTHALAKRCARWKEEEKDKEDALQCKLIESYMPPS